MTKQFIGVRKASEVEYFPYSSNLTCIFAVMEDGRTIQLGHNKGDIIDNLRICMEVEEGSGTLFAVWPGNYRSDLFLIDDVDKYKDSLKNRL